MPRYYIECLEDGEFLPTHRMTIEANTEEQAKGLVLLDMLEARGRIKPDFGMTGEEVLGYNGLSIEDAAEEAKETCYVDVCIELPENFEGNPATVLEDFVAKTFGEILDPEIREPLNQALALNHQIRTARAMSMGGLY